MNYQDAYLPSEATIVKMTRENNDIFTLYLKFTDPKIHQSYHAEPGQFIMVYCYGVGEVPISIVDGIPNDKYSCRITVHPRGTVTKSLNQLNVGDSVGLRGPYGNSWPLKQNIGKDVIIISGGIGCAPTIGAIEYIMQNRQDYGTLHILHGMRHGNDLLFQEQYQRCCGPDHTHVHFAAEKEAPQDWHTGYVTDLIDNLTLSNPDNTICFLCGPEVMMMQAAKKLSPQLKAENIFLSLERNMQCGIGQCGHCQCGAKFVCKDGPIFTYTQVKHLLKSP
jgi:NAD(P)H-flavin reductase